MARLPRVTLEGQHVRLEPLRLDHAPGLLEAASGGRDSYDLTRVPGTPEAMRAYVERALDEEERGESLPFAVHDVQAAREGRLELLGCTRFVSIDWWAWGLHPPPEPLPVGPDALEIGFTWYAARAQRTAVNTEAKILLCAHAFETLRVRRVTWKTDARNARSRAAILRLGARFDGVLRAQRPGADGAVRDTAYYSMLREEWAEAKAALVARLRAPREATC